MGNWADKTTNQIVMEIKEMQEKYESIKTTMIKLYDKMESIEKDFNDANKILKERLNGTNE